MNDERNISRKKYSNRAFLNTEWGDFIMKNGDSRIDINEIRQELSVIRDSLADEVNQSREER